MILYYVVVDPDLVRGLAAGIHDAQVLVLDPERIPSQADLDSFMFALRSPTILDREPEAGDRVLIARRNHRRVIECWPPDHELSDWLRDRGLYQERLPAIRDRVEWLRSEYASQRVVIEATSAALSRSRKRLADARSELRRSTSDPLGEGSEPGHRLR